MIELRIALVMAVLATTTPAVAACMKANSDGETAEGRVQSGRFQDAAGRPESAFILRLPAPMCLEGSDADDKVESAHDSHLFVE